VRRCLLIHAAVVAALVSPGLLWLAGGVDIQQTLARKHRPTIVAVAVAPASAAVVARAKGGHDLSGASKSQAALSFALGQPLAHCSPALADASLLIARGGYSPTGCRAPPRL
jgi:hypothetical protein